MHTNQKGYTVVELCVVLAILSILYLMMIPSFYSPLMRTERILVIARLRLAIALAKQHAFSGQSSVTLCPSVDAQNCKTSNTSDWSQGFILIKETPSNKLLKTSTLIRRFAGTHFGNLYFDRFGDYLRIESNAYTNNSGTFTYCPKNGNRLEATALVINHASRTYELHQRNAQGILLNGVGTSKEKPISCR